MRLSILTTMLSLLCLQPAVAADKTNKDPVQRHQGVWKPIAASLNGGRLPKEASDKITLRIDGNKYEATVEGEDHDDRGTFTVDTSVKPHKKVIKSESGLNKGKTIYAIFEHKNENGMRVAYDLSGKGYPTTWCTKMGSPYYAVGCRRRKEAFK